jgi:hypothetical protein
VCRWTFGARLWGSIICSSVFAVRRAVRGRGFPAVAQFIGAPIVRNIGTAVIHGRDGGSRFALVLQLRGSHRDVGLMSGGKFRCGRPSIHSSWPVEAGPTRGIAVCYVSAINVVNYRSIYVCYLRVVKILVAVPVAAVESHAGITKSVVNPSVETHGNSPVARVPHINSVREAPIARSPKQTCPRRHNPNPRYPVVTGIAICPVSWFPNVTRTGANWLGVHGKYGRGNANRDRNANGRGCTCACGKCKTKQSDC